MSCNETNPAEAHPNQTIDSTTDTVAHTDNSNILDTALYNDRLQNMSNGDTLGLWPVKTAYPLAGAILPFNRIIAFYGNLYSTRMGILGELPKD